MRATSHAVPNSHPASTGSRRSKRERARPALGGSFARRLQDTESDTGYDTPQGSSDGALAVVSQTAVYDTCHVYHDFASGVRDDLNYS